MVGYKNDIYTFGANIVQLSSFQILQQLRKLFVPSYPQKYYLRNL